MICINCRNSCDNDLQAFALQLENCITELSKNRKALIEIRLLGIPSPLVYDTVRIIIRKWSIPILVVVELCPCEVIPEKMDLLIECRLPVLLRFREERKSQALVYNGENLLDELSIEIERYISAVAVLRVNKIMVEAELPLITGYSAEGEVKRLWKLLQNNGITRLQIEPLKNYLHTDKKLTYSPDALCDTLCLIFDLWLYTRNSGITIYVREIENIAGVIRNVCLYPCGLAGACQNRYLLEGQKTISQCKPAGVSVNDQAVAKQCITCRWVSCCHGGCLHEQINGINCFCKIYMRFFEYTYPKMLDFLRNQSRHL